MAQIRDFSSSLTMLFGAGVAIRHFLKVTDEKPVAALIRGKSQDDRGDVRALSGTC